MSEEIVCRICGEPWDYESLYGEALDLEESRDLMEGNGCPACEWHKKNGGLTDHTKEWMQSVGRTEWEPSIALNDGKFDEFINIQLNEAEEAIEREKEENGEDY